MIYTVTRTVTIVERWYNIRAASPEEAAALLEEGHITRPPDKEDCFGELIDAEPDDRRLGTYTLVGEFSEPERVNIARLFSTIIPAAEHAGWTISRQGDVLSAIEPGGILSLFATSVSRLCRAFEDVYLGHTIQDDSGNNRCTTWVN